MRYLMRDGAPLTDSQWGQIDAAVVQKAKETLVGRRFLTLVGPVGASTQNVHLDTLSDNHPAADFWGDNDESQIRVKDRRFVNLAAIYSDFRMSWRDVENERGAGVQAAIDAAMAVARREDDVVFHGLKEMDIDGVFTAEGVNRLKIGDWNKGEAPLQDVVKAIEVLVGGGASGQRALVVSSDLWGKLHRIQAGTGIMEVDRVRSLVNGGLFSSTRIGENKAVLLYTDPHNIDLVVGQDLTTAYLGNEQLDHIFRVFETVVPRVKRPRAIAVLE
ncbi:MAG: bacteriocin family protein [Planctomycetota bacterium]|jgi:uncharacterized linocin/CFP29 family protein|nr:bacteriocin family protein [Planctomycetota bacterium]